MWLLLLPFLGIASAGRLGHHADRHSTTESVATYIVTWDGIMIFKDRDYILRNGELIVRGPPFTGIGTQADHEIPSGFANLITGERVHIDGGSVASEMLLSTDPQISNSLARAGLTLEQFIQLTGTIPPQQGLVHITAGALSINGNLNRFVSGVLVVLSLELVDPTNTGVVQPPTGPAGSGDLVQTVTVTETAAFETRTVVEPVTLIKTQTIDQFETVTAPNYASVLVSVTNIVKQTQTVTEEEVIRSPVAGTLIVNTVPVPSETVINVQARTTNYFVRTVTEQVSLPQTHFVTIHSIRTNTVNNPATSTITQVISQTRVSTVYKTSVVGSTVYTTSTTIVTIGTAGGTTTVPAGYY